MPTGPATAGRAKAKLMARTAGMTRIEAPSRLVYRQGPEASVYNSNNIFEARPFRAS
jgi:hypothetical protein